ncbi:MAG: ArsR/SmtB family transcription factor [Solirubrobacteraceae bacterium]
MAAYRHSNNDVFRALADPNRRLLLDSLNQHNGQTLRELCSGLDMARQSVSKHLAVLEGANLVTTIRHGREKLHYLNPTPINEIDERWINRYERTRVRALADLKRTLEDISMDKPTFVYTTYIRTTPEQLWEALTDPAFTERYWGATLESDWKLGATMTWIQRGVTIADPAQVVLECDPHRRLAYSWHSFSPEFAESLGLTDEARERIIAEQRSKVSFDIEPFGELVKLTVIHDGFAPESVVASMVSQGWPSILSSLKTLLETGEALPTNPEPRVTVRLGLAGREDEVAGR